MSTYFEDIVSNEERKMMYAQKYKLTTQDKYNCGSKMKKDIFRAIKILTFLSQTVFSAEKQTFFSKQLIRIHTLPIFLSLVEQVLELPVLEVEVDYTLPLSLPI